MGGQDALEQALADADGLIREQPNNPYFWELKGDFLQKAFGGGLGRVLVVRVLLEGHVVDQPGRALDEHFARHQGAADLELAGPWSAGRGIGDACP